MGNAVSSATLVICALVLRVLLAFILARAALHKWRARARFAEHLRAYRLLPDALVAPAAIVLMFAETTVAITLLNPEWRAPGLIAAALFALYAAAMAINLSRGRTELDCGCGGALAARTTLDWLLVSRNALLVGAAIVAFATAVPALPMQRWLIVLAASAAAVLLYESLEQAIANRQRVARWRVSWKH